MIIPKLAIIAFLTGGLTACAGATFHEYGNFTASSAPALLNEAMVADTVKQLVTLFPPGSTRFDFGQPTTDAFGTRFVQSLRLNGYALSEFVPTPTFYETNQGGSVAASPGLNLRYVVDAPDGLNLHRVTVVVGSQSLSRAYTAHNNLVTPAGAWARRE